MTTRLALALAALALLVAGCGGSDKSSEQTASTPAATDTPTAAPTATATATEDGDQGEDKDKGDGAEAADKDCDEVKGLDGQPKRQPPDDVRILDSARLYSSEGPFGKTVRFFASADGDPDSLPATRDDAANMLVQDSGFVLQHTDQEEGAEAEAHLKGTDHTVDIQVIPLCKGKVRIRYTVQ